MRDRIAAEAKKDGRSMNAKIVARLQTTFDDSRVGISTETLKDWEYIVRDLIAEVKELRELRDKSS